MFTKPFQHVRKQRRLLRSMDGFLRKKQKPFLGKHYLIGPYKIKNKSNNKELTLWCLTMIDHATGWIEIEKLTIRNP